MTTDSPGLYIHIPFCASKCPYCDFYSLKADEETKDRYTHAIIKNIILKQAQHGISFPTVYFGGGTPSLLGRKRLVEILRTINKSTDCEVTVECNPSDLCENWTPGDMLALADAGANRIGASSVVKAAKEKGI